MSPCEACARALARALALEEVDAATLRHAEACPECAARLARERAYALVTTRARRAHEAEEDLSPAAWARVRAGVEGARGPRWTRWGFGLAAAVAVVALAWVVAGGGAGGAPDGPRAVASAVAGLPRPGAPIVVTAPAAARDGDGRRLALAPGDLVEAPAGRVITAYGRHALTLAPGTRIRVVAWSERKMTLALLSGSVTSEVTRADGEEVYEIQTAEATVRVLGTIFTVSRVEGAGATEVSVARGEVSVTDAAGVEQRLTVGQRATVTAPTEAADEGSDEVEAADARRPPAPRPREAVGQRVIEIDVPNQRMSPGARSPDFDGDRALRAIEFAIVRGRCDVAMKALERLILSVGPDQLPAARVAELRASCASDQPTAP